MPLTIKNGAMHQADGGRETDDEGKSETDDEELLKFLREGKPLALS